MTCFSNSSYLLLKLKWNKYFIDMTFWISYSRLLVFSALTIAMNKRGKNYIPQWHSSQSFTFNTTVFFLSAIQRSTVLNFHKNKNENRRKKTVNNNNSINVTYLNSDWTQFIDCIFWHWSCHCNWTQCNRDERETFPWWMFHFDFLCDFK